MFNQYKTIKLTLLRMKQFLIPVNKINSLKSKTLSETKKPSVKGNHSLKTYKSNNTKTQNQYQQIIPIQKHIGL